MEYSELETQIKKDAVSKPISQSQLLWVQGVAKRDDMDMEDEDQLEDEHQRRTVHTMAYGGGNIPEDE